MLERLSTGPTALATPFDSGFCSVCGCVLSRSSVNVGVSAPEVAPAYMVAVAAGAS